MSELTQITQEEKNHFKLIKVTPLDEVKKGEIKKLSTSDLSIQGPDFIAQYRFVEGEEPKRKTKVKPGCYTMVSGMAGVALEKFDLKVHNLLEDISNTKTISDRASQFFNNLEVYEELEQPKIRNILLYSDPGFGKSAAINKVSLDFLKSDPGTIVVNWNTSSVRSSEVERFFSIGTEFAKEVTRMILIIEDIGGGEQEYEGNRAVDSSLLGLLDGNSVNFRVPTFTIATTNYPANLLSALADRPGRFDEMIKLSAPSAAERVKLAEFINKKPLSQEEKDALFDSSLDSQALSIAHIKEIVLRSRLTGKSYVEIIKDMVDHKEKFSKGFSEKKSAGI
jgi:ATP-dependent 26S proteasome regulatory subunit